jgi:pSer/pThr/pTyr-binding forkhead associated (FHA) protein
MDDQPTNNISPEKNVFLIINQQITSLSKSVTRLGRQLENDIVFQEESISRNHAEIRYEDDKYILYDQQSTSGTYVNGLRIERCVLNSGDLISLATIQFMFVNNNPKIASHSAIKTRTLLLPPDEPKGKNHGE